MFANKSINVIKQNIMIKANELRIGNYVEVENYKIIKLENIHQKGTTIKDEQYLICMLKPIPLTEDILLKCGFEKYNKHKHPEMYGYYMYDVEYLHTVDDGVNFLISGFNKDSVKYLHQLQNLYFALTGKELEVNI